MRTFCHHAGNEFTTFHSRLSKLGLLVRGSSGYRWFSCSAVIVWSNFQSLSPMLLKKPNDWRYARFVTLSSEGLFNDDDNDSDEDANSNGIDANLPSAFSRCRVINSTFIKRMTHVPTAAAALNRRGRLEGELLNVRVARLLLGTMAMLVIVLSSSRLNGSKHNSLWGWITKSREERGGYLVQYHT